MSTHRLALIALPFLILAALACNASTPTPAPKPTVPSPPPIESTQPSPPTAAPPTEPPQEPGSISGKLCFPGEGIPPLTIYAVDQADGKWFKVQIREPGESSYRLDGVTPGTYMVYAWLNEGNLGGTYSEAVPCGLNADCTDHSLISVTVESGQEVTDIDVCDWYGPPPPPPPK